MKNALTAKRLSDTLNACGHADSAVTRDIYLHVTQLMKDKDAEILDGIRMLKPTKVLPKRGKPRKIK